MLDRAREVVVDRRRRAVPIQIDELDLCRRPQRRRSLERVAGQRELVMLDRGSDVLAAIAARSPRPYVAETAVRTGAADRIGVGDVNVERLAIVFGGAV